MISRWSFLQPSTIENSRHLRVDALSTRVRVKRWPRPGGSGKSDSVTTANELVRANIPLERPDGRCSAGPSGRLRARMDGTSPALPLGLDELPKGEARLAETRGVRDGLRVFRMRDRVSYRCLGAPQGGSWHLTR
jgi:hypothetical protein